MQSLLLINLLELSGLIFNVVSLITLEDSNTKQEEIQSSFDDYLPLAKYIKTISQKSYLYEIQWPPGITI